MDAIVLRRELACATAPSALFAVLADTDRLYRTLGQVAVSREPLSGEGSARFLLRARGEAKAIPFTEIPPQWSHPSLLVTKRVLHQGFLASLATRFTLTPRMQGTQLLIEMQVEPRLVQLGWLVKLYAQATLWHLSRTILRIDDGIPRGEPTQFRPAQLAVESLRQAQQQTKTQLPTEEHHLVDSLVAHLLRTDDLDVDCLRLGGVSEALGVPESTALRLLLLAASAQLVQFGFDVLCPSCRNPAAQVDHLTDLTDEAFCTLCELRIPVEFASNVEVTFRPASSLRKVSRPLYSSVNPATAQHVITQLVLPGTTKLTMTVPNEPGEFRLWARGGATGTLRVTTLGPSQASVTVGDTMVPAEVEVAMGGTLEIDHQTGQARHFKLERPDWKQQRLDGHQLTLHPLFRRLFPHELPKPSVQLAVPTVALWRCRFASLGELCAALGDSGAFRQLQDCQQAMRKAVDEAAGAVLRSDSDGLTVAFASGAVALRCAIAVERALRTLRADNPFAHLLLLKFGLYHGPATVVGVDKRLDYFGQTVAVCDRMVSEAHPGDILVPAELLSDVSGMEGIKAGPIFSLTGRGLSSPVAVSRLTVES